jgi:hypothetical protein
MDAEEEDDDATVIPIPPLAQTMAETQDEGVRDEGRMIDAAMIDATVTRKCHHRSCPLGKKTGPAFQLLECCHHKCDKVMHFACYERFVLLKNAIENPFPDKPETVFCTKLHLNRGSNYIKTDDEAFKNIQWDKDGKDGADDPNNSMSVLLDWLTSPGNYSKYKGDTSTGGKTKKKIADDIAQRINAVGVRKVRTAKAVISKIDQIIASYRKASDWASATGAGVLETEGKEPFNAAVSSV